MVVLVMGVRVSHIKLIVFVLERKKTTYNHMIIPTARFQNFKEYAGTKVLWFCRTSSGIGGSGVL